MIERTLCGLRRRMSKALLDTWDAKRIVAEETHHLHGIEYFRYLREQAERAFPAIRHRTTRAPKPSAAIVAEGRSEYTPKDDDAGKA